MPELTELKHAVDSSIPNMVDTLRGEVVGLYEQKQHLYEILNVLKTKISPALKKADDAQISQAGVAAGASYLRDSTDSPLHDDLADLGESLASLHQAYNPLIAFAEDIVNRAHF